MTGNIRQGREGTSPPDGRPLLPESEARVRLYDTLESMNLVRLG